MTECTDVRLPIFDRERSGTGNCRAVGSDADCMLLDITMPFYNGNNGTCNASVICAETVPVEDAGNCRVADNMQECLDANPNQPIHDTTATGNCRIANNDAECFAAYGIARQAYDPTVTANCRAAPLTFAQCQDPATDGNRDGDTTDMDSGPNFIPDSNTDLNNGGGGCVEVIGTVTETRLAICAADEDNDRGFRSHLFTTLNEDITHVGLLQPLTTNYFWINLLAAGHNDPSNLWVKRGDSNTWRPGTLRATQFQQLMVGTGADAHNALPGDIVALSPNAAATDDETRTDSEIQEADVLFFRIYSTPDTFNPGQGVVPDFPDSAISNAGLDPEIFDGDHVWGLALSDVDGRPRTPNLACETPTEAAGENQHFFLLTTGMNADERFATTDDFSEDALRLASGGLLTGLINGNSAMQLGNFSFAVDSSLKNLSIEHRFAPKPLGDIESRAYTGWRFHDGGQTNIYYHKSVWEYAPNPKVNLYAMSSSGSIRSELYESTSLGGYAAGVFAAKILRHDDSYHVRFHSPFSADEVRRYELAADARYGTPGNNLRLNLYRRLKEKKTGARLIYRHEIR